MKITALILLLTGSWLFAAERLPVDPAEKAVIVAEQTAHKTRSPRYFYRLKSTETTTPGLSYTVDRYTHGVRGEGYVINWQRLDGTNIWVMRENFGPAKHEAHDWRLK